MRQANTPEKEYTISLSDASSLPGCYHVLTILVFPVAFYVLQLLGTVSGIALALTGMLVLIKVVVDWSLCSHHPSRQRVTPCPAPVRPVHQARVLSVECALCGRLDRSHSYDAGDGLHLQVCGRCSSCLDFSSHLVDSATGLRGSGTNIYQRRVGPRASSRGVYGIN